LSCEVDPPLPLVAGSYSSATLNVQAFGATNSSSVVSCKSSSTATVDIDVGDPGFSCLFFSQGRSRERVRKICL
jgi:hypothetical protein